MRQTRHSLKIKTMSFKLKGLVSSGNMTKKELLNNYLFKNFHHNSFDLSNYPLTTRQGNRQLNSLGNIRKLPPIFVDMPATKSPKALELKETYTEPETKKEWYDNDSKKGFSKKDKLLVNKEKSQILENNEISKNTKRKNEQPHGDIVLNKSKKSEGVKKKRGRPKKVDNN